MRISDWSSDVCSSDLLPYGTHLGDLLSKISYSERSARTNLQLFRQSVKERQRALLEMSLRSLETAALTARSGTSDEARLRQQEADHILRWVDRAKLGRAHVCTPVTTARLVCRRLLETT